MTLHEAKGVVADLYGRDVHYCRSYGTSMAREAVRTILDRVSATDEDCERARALERTLNSGRRST